MSVGGVLHQVKHGRAAGDETERLIIGAGEVGQQVAQVIAGQQSVLVAFLMLQDFESIQHEEIASRTKHGANDLRPQAGGWHLSRVNFSAAEEVQRGFEEFVNGTVFVEAPPEKTIKGRRLKVKGFDPFACEAGFAFASETDQTRDVFLWIVPIFGDLGEQVIASCPFFEDGGSAVPGVFFFDEDSGFGLGNVKFGLRRCA